MKCKKHISIIFLSLIMSIGISVNSSTSAMDAVQNKEVTTNEIIDFLKTGVNSVLSGKKLEETDLNPDLANDDSAEDVKGKKNCYSKSDCSKGYYCEQSLNLCIPNI